MKVRKVGLADLDELREIGVDSYNPHYSHMWKTGGLEWYTERCFGIKFLKNEVADPNVEYYIISTEGKNIGILKLVLKKSVPESSIENALYLEKIYFIREWTGRGIGRELIDFTLERARAMKRDCVWLVAMDTAEKPVEAYKRAGFTIHTHQFLDFELLKDEYKGTFVMINCFNENNGN